MSQYAKSTVHSRSVAQRALLGDDRLSSRIPGREQEITIHQMTGAPLRGKPGLFNMGILVVEMIIGYEWLVSGLVKFVRGDFPAGLAKELLKKMPDMAPWYGDFLKSAVIPNARFFGYAIEAAELLAGIALIVGPLVWLFAWDRVSDRARYAVLFFTASAAVGGAFLAINLHIANGGHHPWLIPQSSFDEGIDLDSVLPAIQIVFAAVSFVEFRRLRAIAGGTPLPQSPSVES